MLSENEFFARLYSKGLSLTEQQKQAVVHEQGPLLLLAVPGAGKTTVLCARLAYLIQVKDIEPGRILCLTFGKAAAREMQERFTNNFYEGSPTGREVKFSTIHSFAYEIVRKYYYKNGMGFEIIEELTGAKSKKGILRRIYEKHNRITPNEEQLEQLESSICYVKNTLGKIENSQSEIKNFAFLYKDYEEYKRTSQPQLIDYDDMLALAFQILIDSPKAREIYYKRYDYILTDESQDTSLIQHKLLELITKPKENLFVVGDDDQSIFGFRAAEPKYLLDFQKVYPKAKILRMEQNFRSTPQIVNISCRFIRSNKLRFDKGMFTMNSPGKPLELAHFKDQHDQYRSIMNELQKTKDLSKVGILYRNNLSAVALAEELSRRHIPFYMKEIGKQRFFTHWAIQDMLNFLRLSFSDKSVAVFERIWTKLPCRVSKSQLAFLKSMPIDRSIFDILAEQPDTLSKVKLDYQDVKSKFKNLNKLPPVEAIWYIRNDLGYNKTVTDICNSLGFSREHIYNLLDILSFIAQNEKKIVDFANHLLHLEEQIKHSYRNKNSNAVTLSTIHSAKGLEWDKVILVDLIEGVIPESEAMKCEDKGQKEQIEEERRLFYVGMTRAKKELMLCSMDFYHKRKAKVSRFVREVNQLITGKETQEINPKELALAAEWGTGLMIEHKIFGKGVITEENNKVIMIKFKDGSRRTFLKEICEKEDLIWAI